MMIALSARPLAATARYRQNVTDATIEVRPVGRSVDAYRVEHPPRLGPRKRHDARPCHHDPGFEFATHQHCIFIPASL
jgi:hypothetical protein